MWVGARSEDFIGTNDFGHHLTSHLLHLDHLEKMWQSAKDNISIRLVFCKIWGFSDWVTSWLSGKNPSFSPRSSWIHSIFFSKTYIFMCIHGVESLCGHGGAVLDKKWWTRCLDNHAQSHGKVWSYEGEMRRKKWLSDGFKLSKHENWGFGWIFMSLISLTSKKWGTSISTVVKAMTCVLDPTAGDFLEKCTWGMKVSRVGV